MHIKIYSANQVRPMKWRGGVLTEFDGKRWSNPNVRAEPIEVSGDHAELEPADARPAGSRLNYHVDLEPLENDALFFAGTPETLDLHALTIYRLEGPVYRLGRRGSQGVHYDAYARLEERPETALPLYPPPVLPLPARERTLQLPPLDRRIPELARSFTATSVTDLERARAIERQLRTRYGYTLELPDKQLADPIANFLFTRRKGHCEYFASAMAVLLRSINIPARLATGFQSGVYNPVSDLWLVRASDAHSWVEAWIPGRGWTTFDPTPPDPGARTSLPFLNTLSLYMDAAETFWQEWVVTYDIARQGTLAGRMEQGAHRLGIRWFDSVTSVGTLWSRIGAQGVKRYGIGAAGVALSLLLAWMAAGPLLRGMRWRTRVARVRRGQASVADATLLYDRMLQLLKRRGYQKPPWFTPSEFAASLPASELRQAVGEFTVTYNALRFGGQAESAVRLSVLLEEVERAPAGD
jgi:transglutaminase-like putative cysteine protease